MKNFKIILLSILALFTLSCDLDEDPIFLDSNAVYSDINVAKAALEASVRYLATELGERNIRVNSISAGPVKTLAAKGITGFDILLKVNAERSPMKRNVTLDEVGNAGLYLCSDLSSGVTGETHHVDCGYHSIATSRADAKIIGITA